jgi:NAD(P)-dependent dehydrogenase (short-subunit alcohol dehydrogenase family)
MDSLRVRLGESDKLPPGSGSFDARLLKQVLAAVADVALALARNGYVTGQTVNVNGGWYMS